MLKSKQTPPVNDLHLGPQGIVLIKHYEELRLRAYPDPASELARALRDDKPIGPHLSGDPWSVGFGDTGPDVLEGMEITEQEAEARLLRRLAEEFEPAVRRAVWVPLQQHQFDALVSLSYNCGCRPISQSKLVRLLNQHDCAGAAGQFRCWNKAGGRVLLGLKRRREAERLVFLGMDAEPAIAMALRAFP